MSVWNSVANKKENKLAFSSYQLWIVTEQKICENNFSQKILEKNNLQKKIHTWKDDVVNEDLEDTNK